MENQQNLYEITRIKRIYDAQYAGFIQLYNELSRDFKSFNRFVHKSKGRDFSSGHSMSRRDIAFEVRNKYEVVQLFHSRFNTYLQKQAFDAAQIIIDYLVYALDFARYAYNDFFNRKDKKLRNWSFATSMVRAGTVGLGSSISDSIAPGSGKLYGMAATGVNSFATQAMEVALGSRERIDFKKTALEVGFSYTFSFVTDLLPQSHSILPNVIKNSSDFAILLKGSSKEIALSVLEEIMAGEMRPH
jgi:hypothetical protein